MTPARLIVGETGTRLDRYLRDELGPRFGRRRVAALLRAGAVRVNGRVAAKGTALRPGDEVTVDSEALAVPQPEPLAAPLAILHCDDTIVAVDKPPSVPSTTGASTATSLAAALLHRFPEMAALAGGPAAGLVHRLDTATSGLLVAARTPEAYRRLRDAFGAKILVKEYLAVVRGQIDAAGLIDAPLARRPRRTRMVVVDDVADGWPAVTEYRPLAQAGSLTLVHLRMRTGVTHQLRVHLAHLGHPVLGDRRYGSDTSAGTHAWHYLHALRIYGDRGDVLPELATPFPRHWAPLFAALGWATEVPPRW